MSFYKNFQSNIVSGCVAANQSEAMLESPWYLRWVLKVIVLNNPENFPWAIQEAIANHYCDAIMGTIASEITSLTIVYTTVYSDADQNKHQSSASLAFVWGIHRDRWIPRTKDQLRGKCFHLMTSSW